MKSVRIVPLPKAVKAQVAVPGSKSYTIRALLLAAMTARKVRIREPLICDDTEAMLACLERLGIKVRRTPEYIEVTGNIGDVSGKTYALDAGLSGITLRFLLALSCVIPGRQTLGGKPSLNVRPVGDMVESLRALGAKIDYLGESGYPPLRIRSSKLARGKAMLAGGGSSQYLSALLMIAPLAGGLDIGVTGSLISRPYVDMTTDIMEAFGVKVGREAYGRFTVGSDERYDTSSYRVEGDVSSASYFFAVAALTKSTITVNNLNPGSLQADMGFLKILERMGSRIEYGKDSITVAGKGARPLDADMGDCPDQAQTLAVLAAFADGKTRISGIGSLRIKETERIQALQKELKKMGIKTTSTPDSLTIRGGRPRAALIDTYGDHRMAMAFAVAGARLKGMEIRDPGVVGKTFPGFWDKLSEIGVRTEPSAYNIVLIGMRGTGKTTVARELARKLDIRHLDLDEIMAERLSLSTPEIVARHGWGYFRDQEAAIAKDIAGMDNVLISTGGGIVLRPDNIEALSDSGLIILLSASLDVMLARLEGSKDRPPLTDKKSLRAEILQVRRERQPLYEAAADLVVDTDDLEPSQTADLIIAKLGRKNREK